MSVCPHKPHPTTTSDARGLYIAYRGSDDPTSTRHKQLLLLYSTDSLLVGSLSLGSLFAGESVEEVYFQGCVAR